MDEQNLKSREIRIEEVFDEAKIHAPTQFNSVRRNSYPEVANPNDTSEIPIEPTLKRNAEEFREG